jgi:large subunit ribosomal protein L25
MRVPWLLVARAEVKLTKLEFSMSEHFTLNADIRSDLGKGASRRLRRLEDKVPGIIYGAHKPAQNLSLSHSELLKVLKHEAIFSSIIKLVVNGKPEKAILRDLQRHASKPRLLHIDFQRVSEKEKLHMHVPLHFMGEERAPGIKEHSGILNKSFVELEILCLPSNLPEYIEVDISMLDIDQSIHLSEIKLPKGVELAHAIEDAEHDLAVISIIKPRVVEETTEAPVAAEVPATAQKTEEPKK